MQEIITAIQKRITEAKQFIATSQDERNSLISRMNEVDAAERCAEDEVIRLERALAVLNGDVEKSQTGIDPSAGMTVAAPRKPFQYLT